MHRNRSFVLQIIIAFVLFFIASMAFACGGNSASSPLTDDSPTAAYKRLYAAVKSKDIDAIKQEMSKQSNTLVASIAAQQKKPVEEIYGNGLTTTLKSDTLPEIRDERVNGQSGAVEVYNTGEHKWNDIPFVVEDGRWKLALGDAFAGKFAWPGKGRDQLEKEAANALSNRSAVPANPVVNSSPPVGTPAHDSTSRPVNK
jgi:hypothetical protein